MSAQQNTSPSLEIVNPFRAEPDTPQLDVDFMSRQASYDPDNDLARVRRVAFQQALPEILSKTAIGNLAQQIHDTANDRLSQEYFDERKANKQAQQVELQFLRWLGKSQVDGTVIKDVNGVLKQRHGLKGRLVATTLMAQRIVQY
jgi:hypothetical protein